MNKILTEVNISSIKPTSLVKNVMRIDKETILITIPDTNMNIWETLYDSGVLLSNCRGIISPNKTMSVGKKQFNTKVHQLELKANLIKREGPGKKLTVYSTVPKQKSKGIKVKAKSDFNFYDASIFSQAVKYLDKKGTSERLLATILFNELQTIYKKIKKSNPITRVELMFLVKDNEGSVYNIIKELHVLIKDKQFKDYEIYDNFMFVSSNKIIYPIAHKVKGVNTINKSVISKLNSYLSSLKKSKVIAKKPISIKDNSKSSFVDSLIRNLKTSNLKTSVDDDGNVKIGLATNVITKLLKKYKIYDPDIAVNVKSALDAYIKAKDGKITKDETEQVILKAINYTIHGTDIVSDEYLADPALLFNKLKDTKTHRVPLNFPDLDYSISPEGIIDINYTTGQHRQKFEFEQTIHENIKKLFKSIEDVKEHPIKVLKIEHEVKDDNLDRFINFTATLQNTTGENTKPYKVDLKVPAPVNEKYFKLRGSSYIIASQQFMKPLTKTDDKTVRLLSNYAIIQLGIKNLKFNPRNIEDIINNYIKIRYPNILKKETDSEIVFSDNSIIYLAGLKAYKDKKFEVYEDEDTGKLMRSDGEEIKYGRYEFLYEKILEKIQAVNPEDNLYKTKKAIPYMYTYMSGIMIPLIEYLWTQKGLLSTLNDFGIDYEIVDNNNNFAHVFVPTKGNKFLAIKPKTTREKLIVNGLLVSKIVDPIKDLNSPAEIFEHITNTLGMGAVHAINNMTENMIDPITKELLQFDNMPTTLPQLLSDKCIDMLLNHQTDSLADLKLYRSRMSEMVVQGMYKQIKSAHNDYKRMVVFNPEKAKLWLDSEFVIRDMITESGVLQYTEPVSPIDEIMMSSRVIKSGQGGVPSARAFKPEHRNIHPSQYGNISANSTPEGAGVGILNRHTLTPAIVNEFGSYGHKDINNLSGWNILAAEEALTPFANQMDSDRLVMAATHAGQTTPIEGAQAPLLATGAEFIVPQITSPRFVRKAKEDGTILKIEKNKTVTVQYDSGEIETIDIIPRLSRTKMGGYISLEMNTIDEGAKFKKNQLIAFTKNFTKDSIYASGRNVFIAVMNPDGLMLGPSKSNFGRRTPLIQGKSKQIML